MASPTVLLPASAYPDVEFPADGSRVEIDILLCSTVEALAEWACDTSQGVFMTSGSPLEERMYATRFRVGVPCDIEALRAFVKALTREEDESYTVFIDRCSQNAIALDVKLEDLDDNLDMTRLKSVSGEDLKRAAKYRRAKKRLLKKRQRDLAA